MGSITGPTYSLTRPVGSRLDLLAETLRSSGPRWTATLVADRLAPVGVLRLWPDWTVSEVVLGKQLRAVLHAWGMGIDPVETTLRHMLYADLHGIESHGSAMLLHYSRGVESGTIDPRAEPEVVRDEGATAVVDGGGGLGHVPAELAMRLAVERAREHGLAAVAVRNSAHFGAAGSYASIATDAGLIGLVTTSVERPAVVPTRGAAARLGTNALALAAPGENGPPFLLDMATSTVSHGRIAVAWRRGRRIPRGWAVDARGRAVTNARAAMEGRRLTPLGSSPALGSHKGYGLATAVELLSAVLPASERTGHLFLALDPSRFRKAFGTGADELTDSLRATEPLDPSRPVLVAGDPERAESERRRAHGIPLPRATVEDIRAVTRAAGVPFILRSGV
jgi:LDH2 family malate/lactate/ureidoglycolate dehydrogenase